MGISSLGIGSSILTQDVLDQLREADEATRINPITLDIANENDKQDALELIDATMENLIDSIDAIKTNTLFDERSAEVTGISVEVSADSNSDIQDFTLNVTKLATKQIEQSGAFASSDETIANGSGVLNLNIDGEDFEIAYDDTTTLQDLKSLINDTAGDKVDATIVQISSGEFRLFMSSVETGSAQEITLTDKAGSGEQLKDTRLTTGVSAIQTGVDAEFEFNGQAITRSSNEIDDLIVGIDISLKELGSSSVSVSQNRDNITEKIDSFVEKYNAAIKQLSEMTLASTDATEKGIFSGESTIKNMKRAIENMIGSVGGGVESMMDYGFDIDQDGNLSIDKTVFNERMDENGDNLEAFLAGGTYTKEDASTVELDGAFNELAAIVEEYTKYNATLDMFSTSLSDRISDLEDKKISMTERLDTKYEIMQKQFAAYDAMISQFNTTSDMFTSMADALAATSN